MSRTITGNWNYPTNIKFGPGAINELANACRELGMTRPLLVTDEGLRELPMIRNALQANEAAGMPTGLFADVQGNPVGGNVDAGVAACKAGQHDGIIAFGGGSALDAAKAIALMVGQDRPLWDFEDVGDNWTRVNTDHIAPVVAVPTTSGTGSEVGRASVITNDDLHQKKIIFHPTMLPGIVISDPELTCGLPPHITAATGIDAFVHCFEALCAPGYHPMADGIALEGMRLIADALPRAFANGNDIEARADMLAAASMGATAFQKGLGGVHALAHPVGAVYNAHHGLANAILLPYVMAANRDAISDRMILLGRTLDLPDANYEGVLKWVLNFREGMDIPNDLAAIGIPADRAEDIGEMAWNDPSAGGNPVALTAGEYSEIFLKAVQGNL
ncbi:MAG: iron-containing alcohol dehydrogenase [Alphaproteobacteria bacterium]|jgi:alcohol dehydrogenase class IV|nr:iron-containing alcohol dehydrogenase [Alphaproteobacteria bacterium]MBT4546025.1 iron-containing alcohol dehydrogenase [Alphaproteobacteria bacterium]MBT7746274.1 iron-containing alcohol dehydrogenase [Alphaproteobacteria bacterium]